MVIKVPSLHCSAVFEQANTAFRKLAMEILELLIEGLGVDANHFEAHKRAAQGSIRANYYHPHDSKDEVHIGLRPHVDGNLLTILHQQDVSGLEVLKDGKWFQVAPQTDAFCVNVADILQVNCYVIKKKIKSAQSSNLH
jgi:isopenicillin N synthase-like dioxygenase